MDIRSEENIAQSTTGNDNAMVLTVVGSGVRAPILYYKGRSTQSSKSGKFTSGSSILGSQGRFRTDHNKELADPLNKRTSKVVEYLKKEPSADGPSEEEASRLRGSMVSAKYLLLGAGVDDIFGTEDDVHAPGP